MSVPTIAQKGPYPVRVAATLRSKDRCDSGVESLTQVGSSISGLLSSGATTAGPAPRQARSLLTQSSRRERTIDGDHHEHYRPSHPAIGGSSDLQP